MQINPFGFPLGAGTQPVSALGGTGLGFVEALGVAIEGGTPQPLTGLTATTPPASFVAKMAPMLAQAQRDTQPVPATTMLSGLQQPTALSQLMATAAKVPAGEPVAAPATTAPAPVEPALVEPPRVMPSTDGAVQPAPVATEPVAPIPAPIVETDAEPAAVPPQPAPAAVKPVPTPVQTVPAPAAAEAEAAALPEAPKPVDAAPAKPQKGPRARAAMVEADPAQPADAKPVIAAEMLPTVVPQQTAQPSPVASREASAAQTGTAAPAGKKVSAANMPAEAPTQTVSANGTPDFARAVAAKGDTGAEAGSDGQAQPGAQPVIAGKTDTHAAHLPQPTHAAAAAETGRATAAPAPAEPVIEARTGHLGHSLGVEIARKVELGEETLRIRLNPIELGRIEVTLAFDDKGSLQATVRAESAQAMDLLRQDAPDLARTLDQAGVRTDAQSFRFEQRGGDSGGQQAQQQHSQNRGQFVSSDDEAFTAEPIYRPVRSDGQVDLLA